jgi:hypothetical protein
MSITVRNFDRATQYVACAQLLGSEANTFVSTKEQVPLSVQSRPPLSVFPRTEVILTCGAFMVVSENFKFQDLAQRWKSEVAALSSTTEIASSLPYMKIVAMGPSVIPQILCQLEAEGDEPDMWFVALRLLADADPVAEEDRGDMRAMARAWLRWGLQQGYAW